MGGELLKDAGVVRVAEKSLFDEPEFAYAWPGEDLPGFLANLIDMRNNVVRWDATPFFQELPERRF